MRKSKSVNGVTSTYYYDGDTLMLQKNSDGTSLFFSYNDAGDPVGFTRRVNGTAYNYYFITNLQGDVIQILDGNHDVVCNYYYDAWSAIRLITDADGNNITDSENPYSIAYINPIRYRGYYYDVETGFYYLQTRYYDPEIGRFISRDSYEYVGANGDIGSFNLFAYCSNNPVGRIDASGSAWCHWLLGAAVVIGCGIATIATCGGFAAAAAAVGMVAGGGAAFTTASTISAGSFIGSSTAYGFAVADAVYNSLEYDEDFAEQGNWGTVAVTAGTGLFSGIQGYYNDKLLNKQLDSIVVGTYSPKKHVSHSANTPYLKVDNNGNAYSFARYDSYGRQIMRIDYQGSPHRGVLPHIHCYVYNPRGGRAEYVYDLDFNIID